MADQSFEDQSLEHQSFKVAGMTCEHCVAAVTSEVEGIEGVRAVRVALVPGGVSDVMVDADRALPVDVVRAAVDEAGYDLVG